MPPTRLLATKTDKDGKTVWTRPLCPYPQVVKYQGTGDPNDAASFGCIEP
jgi:feruloyl esterase